MGFIHKPTNTYFDNRKNAIIVMGHRRYCKALKNKDFDWENDENRQNF